MTTPTIITRLWDLFLVDNYNTPTHINKLIAKKNKTPLLCKEENGKFIQNDHAIPPSIIRAGYTPDFQQKIAKENPGLRVKSAAELNNRK